MLSRSLLFSILVGLGIVGTLASPREVFASVRLGIISDSSTDEYRADDNRAGNTPYAATTLSWMELLVKYRGVEAGAWGTRSEPRRSGYAYNWARTGAQASTLVSSGQHTGVAAQVKAGLIDIVYFQIGNNDFAYYRDGAKIYDGSISGAALQAKLDTYMRDVTVALDAVRTGTSIPIILGTVPDPGQSPYWRSRFPSAANRAKVTAAVQSVNTRIQALATTRSNVLIFDQDAFATRLLSRLDSAGNIVIDGEKISAVLNGDEPHHMVLSDSIHGGTVIEGLFANEVITLINQAGGSAIAPFSDAQILAAAGIRPWPSTTPTATPVGVVCRGDLNGDRQVNTSDYVLFLQSFLKTPPPLPAADFTKDGKVNLGDYQVFVGLFLRPCST